MTLYTQCLEEDKENSNLKWLEKLNNKKDLKIVKEKLKIQPYIPEQGRYQRYGVLWHNEELNEAARQLLKKNLHPR